MFGVFTFSLTHFLAKIIFPGGMGVYKIEVEIPKGWGGYFSGQKLEIPGRRGAYVKFPPWWRYGYFLELHNITRCLKNETNEITSSHQI